MAAAVSVALARRMSATTTAAPSAAKRAALAAPIPDAAPVTMATLSRSSMLVPFFPGAMLARFLSAGERKRAGVRYGAVRWRVSNDVN